MKNKFNKLAKLTTLTAAFMSVTACTVSGSIDFQPEKVIETFLPTQEPAPYVHHGLGGV